MSAHISGGVVRMGTSGGCSRESKARLVVSEMRQHALEKLARRWLSKSRWA